MIKDGTPTICEALQVGSEYLERFKIRPVAGTVLPHEVDQFEKSVK